MAGSPAAARERRARVLLGVLSVVLLGVCGFWAARYLVHRQTAQPAAAPTATAAAAPVAGQPAALTLTQLRSFAGLASRDLFKAQASPQTAAAATTSASTTAPKPATAAPPAQTVAIIAPSSAKPTQPQGPLLPAALLKLNGTKQVVVVGTPFPKSKPIFRLTAVGRSAIWISLLHGTFAGGRTLLEVAHGHPARLVSNGGGSRVSFLLALLRVTARHVPPAQARPARSAATTTVAATTASTTTTAAATTGP
jgi:hypothetical protein